MEIFDYINSEIQPRTVTSDEGLYQRQESQAYFSLPIIHQPFDPANPGHWRDRGHILDFRCSVGNGDLLDFGPGDGWPSLLVAPFAQSVTGVDAAGQRVQVCMDNARRLNVLNFRGVTVRAGEPLPFPNNSFDGVMAADSVEQTPDPKATLRELCRVLKPGGRLRLVYEGLAQYRNGQSRELWASQTVGGVTQLLLCCRSIEEERVVYCALEFDATLTALQEVMTGGARLTFQTATVEGLERVRPLLTGASCWTLKHPSCQTWLHWMREVGFSSAIMTHDGGQMARKVFDGIPSSQRPGDVMAIDQLLLPAIAAVVELPAPVDMDAPITAVK